MSVEFRRSEIGGDPSAAPAVLSGMFEHRSSSRWCRRVEATQVPREVFRQPEEDFASCASSDVGCV